MHTLNFPSVIFRSIIEHLVISIGIYKAAHLRLVNRAFDSEIMFAIFTNQVVDPKDPATRTLYDSLPPALQGRILLAGPRSKSTDLNNLATIITNVNQALDGLTKPNKEQKLKQHRMISEAVSTTNADYSEPRNVSTRAQAENVLCGAIVIGNLDLVKKLLPTVRRYAANIGSRNKWLGMPLQIAASWGHLEIVQYLLDYGADPTSFDIWTEGRYPRANFPIGHVFLNVSHHAGRNQSGSPLRAAALGGYEQIVKLLLKPEHQRKFDELEYRYAILAAARGGHLSIMDLLLQNAKNPINESDTLWYEILFEAVHNNREDMVRELVYRGVDVNLKSPLVGHTVLMIATSRGYARIARFLLERGATLECRGEIDFKAIKTAAERGHEETVDVCLEYGASLEKAFVAAASRGQTRLVKQLLRKGIDIHAKSELYGTTGLQALIHGIETHNPTIISTMVDAGVLLKGGAKDYLPVFYAKHHSSDWIVDFLLSLGAQDCEVSEQVRRQAKAQASEDEYGHVKLSKRTWEWVGRF